MLVSMKGKYYNYDLLHDLTSRTKAAFLSLQGNDFVDHIMSEAWDTLELKVHMRQITINLGKYLPADYRQALDIIDQAIARYPSGYNDNVSIYSLDFIEVYRQDECRWDLSMVIIERYTPSSTAEFAVRLSIIKQEARMMQQMVIWVRHDNEHMRRLTNEGCRPALPWGQASTSLERDLLSVLPILEQPNMDPSLYACKSVINHLNNILKTHPGLAIKIVRGWYSRYEYTDWAVKHGCRTLFKRGNQEVLGTFGCHNADSADIADLMLGPASVSLGDQP